MSDHGSYNPDELHAAGPPLMAQLSPQSIDDDDDDYSSREASQHRYVSASSHPMATPADVNYGQYDSRRPLSARAAPASSSPSPAPTTISSAPNHENRSGARNMVQIASTRSPTTGTSIQPGSSASTGSTPMNASTLSPALAQAVLQQTRRQARRLTTMPTDAHLNISGALEEARQETTREAESVVPTQQQHQPYRSTRGGGVGGSNGRAALAMSPERQSMQQSIMVNEEEEEDEGEGKSSSPAPIPIPVSVATTGGMETGPVSISMLQTHELTRIELAYFCIKPLPDHLLVQLATPCNYHAGTQVLLLVLFAVALAYEYTMGLLIFFILDLLLLLMVLVFFHLGGINSFLRCFCVSGAINQRADEFLLSSAYYLWRQFFFVLLQIVSLICSTCVLFAAPIVLSSRLSTERNVMDSINALNDKGLPIFICIILMTAINIGTFMWCFFTLQQVASQLQYAHLTSPHAIAEHQATLVMDPLVGVTRVDMPADGQDDNPDGLSQNERTLATSAMVIFKQLMAGRERM